MAFSTAFHQIVKLIPRTEFESIVIKYNGDHRVRSLDCWTWFNALLLWRAEFIGPLFGGFASIAEARAWVERFVCWYNFEHQHSEISFVTPASKHNGLDAEILKNRIEIYE